MAEGGSNAGVRIIIFIGVLGLINLLSYVFHLGFWVY
jgi:hypothetical protein